MVFGSLGSPSFSYASGFFSYVMVNFMCQLDWTAEGPDIFSIILLGVSGLVWYLNWWLLSKADCFPNVGYPHPIWGSQSWVEQKVDFSLEKRELFLLGWFQVGALGFECPSGWKHIPGSPDFQAFRVGLELHCWMPWVSSLQILSASISCEKIPDNLLIGQPILLALLLQRTLIHLLICMLLISSQVPSHLDTSWLRKSFPPKSFDNEDGVFRTPHSLWRVQWFWNLQQCRRNSTFLSVWLFGLCHMFN